MWSGIKVIKVETGGKLFSGSTNCHRIALVLCGSIRNKDNIMTAGGAIYSGPLTNYPEMTCEIETTLLLVYLQARNGPPIDSWLP
jgi:hypothetical protein